VGVMRGSAKSSSKFCYIRLMFENRGSTSAIVPLEFASPRPPQLRQPFVSLDVEHGHEGNRSNLTTCATATCEWTSVHNERKVYRSVARILTDDKWIDPKQKGYCTIEIARPPKDLYKLQIYFDNTAISEVTKKLANFNANNPQFFEADDAVEVQIK